MAAPNHKVTVEREVCGLTILPACLPTYVQYFQSIDRRCEVREKHGSVSHHIYFSDTKFMYDLPSRDRKIRILSHRRAAHIIDLNCKLT